MVESEVLVSAKQADTPAPRIELKAVSKTFREARQVSFQGWKSLLGFFRKQREQAVFQDLNLQLPQFSTSKFVVLLGPSGCGKSTMLNLISGLLYPEQGQVFINGQGLTGPNDLAATVPQAYTCFPWLSVLKNVEFGLMIRGVGPKERQQKAREYLEKVGLGDRLNAMPKQLSGGMQQRVAIARTLVLKPAIVLMDEPFGALDAQTRAEMQMMLLKLWAEEQNLVIFVTHDLNEALLLADEVLVFPSRPVQAITAERIFDVKAQLGAQPFRNPAAPAFMNLITTLRDLLKPEAADETTTPQPEAAAATPASTIAGQPREPGKSLVLPDNWYRSSLRPLGQQEPDEAIRPERRALLRQKLSPEMQQRLSQLEAQRARFAASREDDQRWFPVLDKLDDLLDKFLLFATREAQSREHLLAMRAALSRPTGPPDTPLREITVTQRTSELAVDVAQHCDYQIAQLDQTLRQERKARAFLSTQLEAMHLHKHFASWIGKIMTQIERQLTLVEETFSALEENARTRSPEQMLTHLEKITWQTENLTDTL